MATDPDMAAASLCRMRLLVVLTVAYCIVMAPALAQTATGQKATQDAPHTTVIIAGKTIEVTVTDLAQIKQKLAERIKSSGEPYAASLAERTRSNPSFITADGKAHIGGLWVMEPDRKNRGYAILKLTTSLPSSGVALIPLARLTHSKKTWQVSAIEDQHVFVGGSFAP